MYLTRRQRQMLDTIEKFIEQQGYSPTLEEIGNAMGLSSPATVHKHLQNLEAKGMIRRNWNHSRSLELTSKARAKKAAANAVPLLGNVAAGVPIEAIENSETVEVPSEFVGTMETFVLRIKGDSMIEDGIHDGDLIIVEKRDTASTGETVVALVDDGEATVKKFYRERGGKVRLQPANSSMEPLVYKGTQVRIQGVVVGLMRKYRL